MISNSQFFILGAASSSPNNLLMYKVTFSLTSADWANQITCTSGTCSTFYSESVLSSGGSTIYLFFMFGCSTKYLYFAGLSVADGRVTTTRYKSSVTVSAVHGSALNGDYVVAMTYSSTSVVMYSISSSTFIIKSFSGILYGCVVEPSSGRFAVGGIMVSNGYIAKFFSQSISLNSDFSSATWSMVELSASTDDIVAQSGVTIAAPDASFTPVTVAYTSQTLIYNLITSTNSDTYLQISTQSFSVYEATTSTQTPNLSCSFSASTSIVYSLNSYNGAFIPSFVSINSATGVLTIAAPSVSSPTTYSFYIDSAVSGVSGPVQKIINLTIKKCTASNCQICTASDSSVCAICNSGFSLSFGSCNLSETKKSETQRPETQRSEVAKLLSTIVQVVFGAIVLILVGSKSINLSSMASLWSVISQLQILFLLFLTGAYIPIDIEGIITGFTICLNPFGFFQQKFNGDYDFSTSYFDFGLENNNLEKLGIKSDSTIVNMTSFFLSIIIICIMHLCIFLTQKLLSKESKSTCCNKVLLKIHWIIQKLMIFFTFALYIRIILEMNQFILVSCVSEIYQFNFSEVKRIISTIITFLILIGCIAIIVITFLFTLSKDIDKFSESPKKRNKFAHLFEGMSPNKKSRLFVCLLQIRRAVFVILLITIEHKSSIIAISLCVGLQLIYIGFLVAIRPYKEVNCNVIELTNELYFMVFLSSLLKYNTAADWEGTPTTAYTYLLSSNPFVVLLVILNALPIAASRLENSVNNAERSNAQINKKKSAVKIQFGSKMAKQTAGNKVHAKR